MPLYPITIKQKAVLERITDRYVSLMLSCENDEPLILMPVTASERKVLLSIQADDGTFTFNNLYWDDLPLVVVSRL